MFDLNHCFRPREEEVASKVIDGEAIIINLANGVYYSMDKVGALVWDLLQTGCSLEEVISAVTGQYDVTRDQAESNVRDLVQELDQENLVVVSENNVAAPARATPGQDKLLYELPKLEAGFTFSTSGGEKLHGIYASVSTEIAKNLILFGEYSPIGENITAGKFLRNNFYYDQQD